MSYVATCCGFRRYRRATYFRYIGSLFWHVSFVACHITWDLADSARRPYAFCHRSLRTWSGSQSSVPYFNITCCCTDPTRRIVNLGENFSSKEKNLKHKRTVIAMGSSLDRKRTQRTRAEEKVNESLLTQKFMSFYSRSQNSKKRLLTSSFVLSFVRPPLRTEQLGSHWTDFPEIWHLNVFRKSVGKIRISLKCDNNNGHFTWRPIYFFFFKSNLAKFALEWVMCQTRVVEKIKTQHFMSDNLFFFLENRTIYEIVGKFVVEPRSRAQMTIWRMRLLDT